MNLFENLTGAKPFLKWAGGKRQLIPAITKALPHNFSRLKNAVYVEPFIGGGAVLFYIMQAYPNIKQAIINDVNPDLTTAYQTVKTRPAELIKELAIIQKQYFLLTDEEARRTFFDERRAEFNSRNLSELRNTVLLIFLNRTCFNGLYRVNSKNKFNVPFGKYEKPLICDPATITADSELLQRVKILCGDFSQTISHVDGEAFFYFDPPYKALSDTATFTNYSPDGFNDAAQERLARFCRSLDHSGHTWLLSNSDLKNTDETDTYFDRLYKGFSVSRVKAKRNINSNGALRGEISEILVSNYHAARMAEALVI